MKTRLFLYISAVAAAVVLLAGCGQSSRDAAWRGIQPGDSDAKVARLLGRPDIARPTRWEYKEGYFDMDLVIPMDHGVVAARPGIEPPDLPTP